MILWIDIETYSEEELKSAGLYRYALSSSFEVNLFGYAYGDGPVTVLDLTNPFCEIPKKLKEDLFNPDIVKAATNAAFEWFCLSRHFKLDDKQTREWLKQWFDVQLLFLYAGLPAKLSIVSDALGLPEDKAKKRTGTALINYFAKPCKPTKANGGRTRNRPSDSPEKWQQYIEYNVSDVESERELFKRLSYFKIPQFVLDEWYLDNIMNYDGIAVDMQLVDAAIAINDTIVAEGKARMKALTGLDNPGSGAQLRPWINAKLYPMELQNLQKDTVAAVIEQLENPENGEPSEKEALALAVLKLHAKVNRASVKKYYAIKKAVCDDGRIRGCFAFYGASRTGREAGRIVQLQNLAKNFLSDLDGARNVVKYGNAELMKLLYPDPQSILSQLIRTALVPKPGHMFVDYDFHAIEAVVAAWVSDEEWRMEVFRTHGLIYEMSAAQMFGVPFETIVKGHENYRYRARGKVAELALGYAGGENALTKMDFNNELSDEEKIPIRDAWRKASPNIVATWKEYEDAAKHVIKYGGTKKAKKVEFAIERSANPDAPHFMTIKLPSGRKLLYMNARLVPGEYGPQIAFDGLIPNTSKFGEVTTFGGRLFENCCAGNTKVLTERGWVSLKEVLISDRVWDGEQWVEHSGLIEKGEQQTINFNGIWCTPEHKFMTGEGVWREAKDLAGKALLIPRTPTRNHARKARNVKNETIPSMARNDRTMLLRKTQSLSRLRRAWNTCMRKMEKQFCKFLGRYGCDILPGAVFRQNGHKRGLFAGKLQVEHAHRTRTKFTTQQHGKHTNRSDYLGRCGTVLGDTKSNTPIPCKTKRDIRGIFQTRKAKQPVYDLLNCGPNHCFTVMSNYGPVLAHNCVQAIARDCLFVSIRRLHERELNIVMSVHDEHVQEVPIDRVDIVKETTYNVMKEPIPWAPDLPLTSDGWVGAYYRKD